MIKTNKLKGKLLVERFKKLSKPINEMFPIVTPKPLHLRTNKMKPTTKGIMDMEDENEVDLQQIIDELESELEDDESIDIGNYNEEDLKRFVREILFNNLLGKE